VDQHRYDEAWELDPLIALDTVYDLSHYEEAATPLAFGIPSADELLLPQRPDTLLIDLRSESDFKKWHLPAAFSVPIQSLNASTPSPFSDSSILERQWLELETVFGKTSSITQAVQVDKQNVVLLCYDGDTARVATSVLRAKGITANSVKEGSSGLTKRWPSLLPPPVDSYTKFSARDVVSELVAVDH
jgi:rhodanese-related sulfurtransferase